MVQRKIKLNKEQQKRVLELDWIAKTLAKRAIESKHVGDAASLQDIEQVARTGICMAVYDYKDDKGMKLSTYAWARAYAYIGHFFRDKTRMIRVPREEQTLYYRILDLQGKYPDWEVNDFARELNLKREKILSLLRIGIMEPGPLFEETTEHLEQGLSSPTEIYYQFGELFTDKEISLLIRYYFEEGFIPTDKQSYQIESLLSRAQSYIENNNLTIDNLV